MREPADHFYLRLALLAATRCTCVRRRVGAVAVDHRGYEMALGWNGLPPKFPHCSEGHECEGARAPSGTNLDGCLATHAEANLLKKCADVWAIKTIYLTVSPCFNCTKELLGTSCERLVFLEEYSHSRSREIWQQSGRAWELVELPTI